VWPAVILGGQAGFIGFGRALWLALLCVLIVGVVYLIQSLGLSVEQAAECCSMDESERIFVLNESERVQSENALMEKTDLRVSAQVRG
jgi:hypothetical protein